MNFIYVADFINEEASGGAEQNDRELISILVDIGHSVTQFKSDEISMDFVKENKDSFFIISNFVFMFNRMKQYIANNIKYIKIEHDHQYLVTRNPSDYDDYRAPLEDLKDIAFYNSAKAVFVQSSLHEDIIRKNLGLTNVYNVAGNLWSLEILDLLQNLGQQKKKDKVSIMNSPTAHKGTSNAVRYCSHTGLDYELLDAQSHEDFLTAMAQNDKFIFLPETVETLSRIVCEARMMDISVITNGNIGAASEKWFGELKGAALCDMMRAKRLEVANEVISLATA